jgi:hypothetical protein
MAAASEIAQFLRTYEPRTPRTDNNTPRQNPNFTPKSNTSNLAINTNPNTQEKIKVNLSTQPSTNPTAHNLFPSTPKTPYQPSTTPNDPKYKCYRCGQPGHFTRSCSTRISQTEAQVPDSEIDVTENVTENKNITEYPRYLPPHKRTRSGLSLKSGRESVKALAVSPSGPVGEIRTGAPSNRTKKPTQTLLSLSLNSGRESVKASAVPPSGPIGEIRTGTPSDRTEFSTFITFPNNIPLQNPRTFPIITSIPSATINIPSVTDTDYQPPTIAKPLLIQIQISGHQLNALIDTGANINVLSKRVIQRFKFPTKSTTPLKVRGYATRIKQTVLQTTTLPTQILDLEEQ